MNINQGPYQRLIDIIDAILIKNEAATKPTFFLHPSDIPSLPAASRGSDILEEFLANLESKEIIPKTDNHFIIDRKAVEKIKKQSIEKPDLLTYSLPKLDKAAENKLLAERQYLLDKAQVGKLSDGNAIKLADHKISFNDDQATISVGKHQCVLPPYKNEHFFCRAMFAHRANEPIDWSLVYKLMTGGQEEVADAKYRRTVQDTMYALNNRVKEVINTDDALFTWENRTIKRNY